MVYNLCLNYLQNVPEAEDATQEVFVKIHKNISGFDRRSSAKTWIYRLTVNYCLDVLKMHKRKSTLIRLISLFNSDPEKISGISSDMDHPGIKMENMEKTKFIFEKINKLPSQQKTVILLKVTEDLNLNEISEIMQLSYKSAESLLSRARSNLKKAGVK